MILLALALQHLHATSPDLRLSDPRTLRVAGPSPLLRAFHEQTLDSGKASHTLPGVDTSNSVKGLAFLRTSDSSLVFQPKAGFEWRNPGTDGQFAFDAGGELRGQTKHLAFWVDARMVSAQTSDSRASWDGQYQEFQSEGANSRLDYTSFSRYEGKLSYESGLGRIGLGRTREHWGPSYSYPLVLGSFAAPMPLFDWTTRWGDLQVRTLWASLAIDGAGSFRFNTHSRSLYGHRYEWQPTNWLTLGASEALIVYDRQEPAAFLPFAPLFMEKGQGLENDNNGELAFDAEIRPMRGWRCYGEFLVDDVSEPTSLFNDLWKNRWAYTVGTQVAHQYLQTDFGAIVEYSHVEPWVYTHYQADGVQSTHQGFLLGNPSGPNSRSLKTTIYGIRSGLHLESSMEWVWKGTDAGSKWTDTLSDNETTTKTFLAGGGRLASRGEIHFGWSHRFGTVWLDFAKVFASADLQRVQPSAPIGIRLEGTY
jgi:hypothetical protein